jgi:hypothetical protein
MPRTLNFTINGKVYPATWYEDRDPTVAELDEIDAGIRAKHNIQSSQAKPTLQDFRAKLADITDPMHMFSGGKAAPTASLASGALAGAAGAAGAGTSKKSAAKARTATKAREKSIMTSLLGMPPMKEDYGDDRQAAALASKDPVQRQAVAKAQGEQEHEAVDAVRELANEVTRKVRVAAETVSDIQSPFIPGAIRRPVIGTATDVVNPVAYVALFMNAENDPKGTAQGLVDSFTELWQRDATPEQRVQSALNWVMAVAPVVKHLPPVVRSAIAKRTAGKVGIPASEFAPKWDIPEETYATQKGIVKENRVGEYPKADEGRVPPETVSGNRPGQGGKGPKKAPKESVATTPKPTATQKTPEAGTGTPKVEPAAAQGAPKVEDVSKPAPEAKTPETGAEGPKTTGLANQAQLREVEAGIIDKAGPIEGKSAKHWQGEGRRLVDEGADYEALAERIGRKEESLTGESTGILLEGKVRLLNELERIRKRLKEGKASNAEYDSAHERLQSYVENVQAGKAEWSDVGRALQAGTELDTGNYAAVIEHSKDVGAKFNAEGRVELEALTQKVAERDARTAEFEAREAEIKANAEVNATYTKGNRRFSREAALKEIDSVFKEMEALKSGKGMKGKKTGAVSPIGPEDLKQAAIRAGLVTRLTVAYAKLGAANLEELIITVQKAVKERMGFEVSRQEVIDEFAKRQPGKTLSQAQKEYNALKTDARRLSSEAQAKAAKKAEAAAEKAKLRADLAEKKAKTARDKKAAESLARAAREEARDAEALANKTRREFEKIEKRKAELKRQIEDYKQQLDTGEFRVETREEVKIRQDIKNLKAERDMYSNAVKSRIRQAAKTRREIAMEALIDWHRSWKLGQDIGTLARQGAAAAGHPFVGARAIARGIKAARSDAGLQAVMNDIRNAEIGNVKAMIVQKEAKLSLTDNLSHPEEVIAGRLFSKIPGLKSLAGKPLERFQLAQLNYLRSEIFNNAARAGFSKSELGNLARGLNNLTGRGNVREIPPFLEIIMTSPRFEFSRWGTIGEIGRQPLRLTRELVRGRWDRSSAMLIKDMGSIAAVSYGLFKLAEANGYKLNYDPKSSDFLKMRKGDDVWAIGAGLDVRLRDILRFVFTLSGDEAAQTGRDIIGSAVTRTTSPSITTPFNFTAQWIQRASGKQENKIIDPITGRTLDENEKTFWAYMPLIVQATHESMKDGPFAAMWTWAREFVGTNVNRYPVPKKKGSVNVRGSRPRNVNTTGRL